MITSRTPLGHAAQQEAVEMVRRMTCAQEHRGPDDGDTVVVSATPGLPFAVLGHRRLSIIEPTASGHQPFIDAASGNVVTFNGEIFNFRELRAELEALGRRFATATDTEVILQAYSAWGTDSFQRLRGMFALGFWDHARQAMHLVRDHVGVKPLYYATGKNGELLFASEVRALLASDAIPRVLDGDGLLSYLAYGSVQDPFTMVQGVRSLPPGSRLTSEDGSSHLYSFWRIRERSTPQRGTEDVIADVRIGLSKAIQSQLVSDVPLGAFLSGGIDSATIVAIMGEAIGPEGVRTLSVGFPEEEYDESEVARETAAEFGVSHSRIVLTQEEFVQDLPKALAAFDQPSIDGLNTYFVCKLARRAGLTVAMSGVGGDEVFAGYSGFERAVTARRLRFFQRLPGSLRRTVAAILERLAPVEAVRKFASIMSSDLDPYFSTRRLFSERQVRGLLRHPHAVRDTATRASRIAELTQSIEGADTINAISALELQTYVLSTLLRDTDQMSMAHSLEVRVPFLDVDLIETMLTISGSTKVEGSGSKPLLRAVMGTRLPAAVTQRPKRGFELPIAKWTRGSLQSEMRTLLTRSTPLPGDLDADEVLKVLDQYQQGKLNWSRPWALYVLVDWLERNKIDFER